MGRKRSAPHPEKVTITRYTTPDGKRCAKDTPGAIKTTETSDTYFVRLPDPRTGKRGWVSLETADLGQAWVELDALLKRRAREAAGLLDPTLGHAARPIAEHLSDWIEQLRAGGRTGEDHISLMESRLRRLFALAGWERLPQITRDSAVKALQRVQRESGRVRGAAEGAEGRSARTRNHYLRHLKQFCSWCVEEDRLLRSPVQGIDLLNAEIDRRHPRRLPGDIEVGRLMAYLEGSLVVEGGKEPVVPRVRCGMTGPQRALGYRLAMATGFRARELRLLDPGSFDLDRATVTVRAAYAKNRKTATQQLPAWLVEELRVWLAAGGGLWQRLPRHWPGRILLADQEACGIAYQTEEGYWDFHSWRVWYITWAANQPSISPKTLQTMARHSDSRLTMEVYARAHDREIRDVIGRMPRPGSSGEPGSGSAGR